VNTSLIVSSWANAQEADDNSETSVITVISFLNVIIVRNLRIKYKNYCRIFTTPQNNPSSVLMIIGDYYHTLKTTEEFHNPENC
jgi:hypothetical protein